MKLKFNGFLVLLLVLVAQISFAQERVVSGVVSDNAGMPLPGVSVLVKGTQSGTQTDFDGKFSIRATSSQVLIFSYVGMTTRQITASSSSLNVKLESDAQELSEVVVTTALGISRSKKSLGYATQEVKGSVLNEGGTTNAVSALSGNVAGLQVTAPSTMGGSTRIVMRGIGSVTGENRPLIVIDGIPMDNSNYNDTDTQRGAGGRDYGDSSSDINPDDIESISVLKGGPAAALYGSRAGNGAILYTTKSGKNSKGKGTIEFNTGVTMESAYIAPKLQTSYGGGASDTFEKQVINGKTYNIADYATDESWGPKYDANLMHLPWNSFDPEFPADYLVETPWISPKNDVDSFFKTGITTNNSLAFTKATDETSIRLSYTNQKTEGITPNSKLDKNSFSINASAKLGDKLTVEGMASYVLTKGFGRPELGYGDNGFAQKFYQWTQRQIDFNDLKDYKLPNGDQRAWNRSAWDDPTPNYSDNPYWIAFENTTSDVRNRLFGNGKITYKLTPEVSFVGNVYGDTYSFKINEQTAIGSQALASFETITRNFSEFNYEGRAHYDKKFDKFSVNAFAGANRRNYNYNSVRGASVGGLVLPNLYNLSNSKEQARATNFEEKSRTNSIYGFVSLGYDDILFLEATDRQDWFSTVNTPVNYASVGGSFVFSGLTDVSWLNYGKIRGSWAQAGNSTTPYRLTNNADTRVPFQGDPNYSSPNDSNFADLIPELKTTKEIGLEVSLFDKRVGLDISYYDVLTENLITPIQVDPATGFNSTLVNAGTLQNKGFEFTLSLTPVRTNDFSWDIAWNFSKNNNELISLYEGVSSLQLATAPFRARLLAEVGKPYGQIYGTDFVYDTNGNKIVEATGYYKASEQKALGSVVPKYNTGIRNSFKYKNFSLSALIDIQEGGSYFSTTNMWGTYAGVLEHTAADGIRENGKINEGVLADGTPNTKVLDAQTWAVGYYNTVDMLNVFDASYVKLREVTFSYIFPNKYAGPFSSVKISAYGRNLLTWNLDNEGMDPEMAAYGSGNTQGLEGGSLPSTRTYGMNLELKF